VASDFHPDYGVPTEYRIMAVSHTKVTGKQDAADKYRVYVSTMYEWERRLKC